MQTTQIIPDATHLQRWVQDNCGDQSHCVALLDPSRYANAEACAQALGLETEVFDALPNLYAKYSKTLRESGPRLWSAPVGDPAWVRVFGQAFENQAASFLVVPPDGQQLDEHLPGLIRMPQPDGGNLLFRFQDVVVLSALAPMLRAEQKRALLGPASHWLLADLCGNPVAIELPSVQRRGPTVLRLDRRQLAALDDALAPLTVIFQANETDTTLLAGLDKCGQVQLVRERMRRARQHGLRREDDIALYVVLGLQLPEDFDTVGPVAEALERARANGTGFGEEIDQVPVERWREWDEVLDARL